MKGIIFTEFLELVEAQFGLETLDTVLTLAEDEGIYTSVGSYDHKNLVKLIVQLSKQTDIPPEDLQQVFGQSVFKNLLASLPADVSLIQSANTFQFIRHVEEYIHVEVKKLYPEAKPPSFVFINESDTTMTVDYHSARCMSHVCLGLIHGCAEHFNEELDVTSEPQNESGSCVRFHLAMKK
ncbi:heme NO-binding domain-containing protein [Vibrio tapetis]|uniref:Putative guanylate cyclase-related protein n=1 Tax=Vibrio tapetis subsp. tapetis TaxID=1671868 RepID=A0A2N8Z9Y7_9VIBR|nr:heme NO-binding domain-containing protein [Vibrio tapetis]SON48702.1 putative guanylate cyclase-related protein [Vibrio tapetis subsp. tapetis]